MKNDQSLNIVEDKNKTLSFLLHYKKTMENIFVDSSADEKLKRVIPLCFSIMNPENTLIGGVTGWVAYDFTILESIWVDKDSQGSGMGKKLLDKFEQQAREHDSHRILTSTNNISQSLSFWTHNGFELTHSVESKDSAFIIYYLQKDLNS